MERLSGSARIGFDEPPRYQTTPRGDPGLRSVSCCARHVTVQPAQRSPEAARIDSRLDTAKIDSDGRINVDRAGLRAVFGGGKTFSHSLGQKRKWTGKNRMSVPPLKKQTSRGCPGMSKKCQKRKSSSNILDGE
jgi:hypothetical protein